MTSDERSERMELARLRAELTVQDLWLRYLSLGGTGDAFDIDGYLQGLVPLDPFQQDVLAQALNEALQDDYQAHRVPLSTRTPTGGPAQDGHVRRLVEALLDDPPTAPRPTTEPPGASRE